MDYHVSGGVRFHMKDDTGMYRWFLQEVNDRGQLGNTEYVPWHWNCDFEASDLRIASVVEIESDNPSELKPYMQGTLRPEGKDSRDKRRYSFFGTGRTINEFTVRIFPAKEEYCEVHAIVSYTAEWDFEDRTTNDLIHIDVALLPAKYAELSAFIASGYASVYLRLKSVSGFYSGWTPSIRTHDIKVLADAKEQKLEIDEASEITPPTTRKVREFWLEVIKAGSVQAEPSTLEIGSSVKSPGTATGGSNDAAKPPAPPMLAEALEGRFSALEGKISRLSIPLWIAAAALIINLFR